jgi:mono/diheme cytochrome c family protein
MIVMLLRSALLCLAFLSAVARVARAEDDVDYARQVKPILKERCFSCHGALKQKAGLRLDTVALMRAGSDNGSILVPGKPSDSPLVQRVLSVDPAKRMPPLSEGEPLTAKQIELLQRWIEQGAKGPALEKKEEDPREHWAFRKPVRPPLPPVKDAAWSRNPIDAFISAEHARQGLTPQPLASREHQLRRVYLDLIGLPPTREELADFLNDCATAKPLAADLAFEKVVDRLLASPHYGERWGRHWMDVWRYSDWYGRRHVPDVWNSAPQIWRWRDWIVRSLNADKGYDRMVQEMLAADEIAPGDDEIAVATGYIVRNWYALNPHQWMRDLVEHTGKAFLGLTFNCAHCHDHKYDPIAQEEYFRFRAFFEPIELRQDRVPAEGDPGPFQKYDYSVLRKIVKLGTVRVYDDKLDAKTFLYVGGDERNKLKDKPPVRAAGPAFLAGDKLTIDPVPLPMDVYYPALKPFVIQEETHKRASEFAEAASILAKARLAHAQSSAAPLPSQQANLKAAEAHHASADAEWKAYQARLAADKIRLKLEPGDEKAASLSAGKAERYAALCAARAKLVQGEQALGQAQSKASAAAGKDKDAAALKAVKLAEQQLDTVKKDLAAAEKNVELVSDKYTPLGPSFPKTSTGRRRALAHWIAGRDNPLTARVAVNHIWLRHFDRALVETVFDLGRNGKRPSHPALLDWLAVELMDNGWSMKHLHRLIVTSRVYRLQTAAGANPSAAKDPDNRYLWRANARRLEAEAVRDSLLAVAGELDRTLGGPVLENTEEAKSKRRSLYFAIFPEDGGHLKFLELFDAPDPCECYRRGDSVMPQQALALTNNQLAVTQSRLLAQRLTQKLAKAAPEDAFIAAAFEQVLTRGPSAQELDFCRDFLRKQRDLYRQADPKTLGASSDPVLRARESLVRALFSHNDFVTVR